MGNPAAGAAGSRARHVAPRVTLASTPPNERDREWRCGTPFHQPAVGGLPRPSSTYRPAAGWAMARVPGLVNHRVPRHLGNRRSTHADRSAARAGRHLPRRRPQHSRRRKFRTVFRTETWHSSGQFGTSVLRTSDRVPLKWVLLLSATHPVTSPSVV